jgi:hypothetical protein
MSEKNNQKSNELIGYLIFLKHGPPQHFGSSVDLIQQWIKGLDERLEGGESLMRPILFLDEEDSVVAAIQAGEILSIIRGAPLPRDHDTLERRA